MGACLSGWIGATVAAIAVSDGYVVVTCLCPKHRWCWLLYSTLKLGVEVLWELKSGREQFNSAGRNAAEASWSRRDPQPCSPASMFMLLHEVHPLETLRANILGLCQQFSDDLYA